MAQAVCEKPQAIVEAELNQERADHTAASAIVSTALKANGDLSAKSETVKANGDDVSGSKLKANGDLSASANTDKKNRIQVSNTKKPLFFYLNLAKRYIKQYNDVELSALGMAIPTVVTIAEILKSNGVAVEKKVVTSTVDSKDESKGRLVQKAKIEIILERNQAIKDSEDGQSNEEAKGE